MKTILTLMCISLILAIGCETPYTGHLGPEDFNGWIESEANEFVCLWNGFNRICVQSIPGPPGKDGKDGKDGATLVAVHKVEVVEFVDRVMKEIVIVPEIRIEYRDRVVERVVKEFIDREVPIYIFVDRIITITKEVIKEVIVEKEVIKEVPVPQIVEVVKTVYIEVPADPEFPIYIDQSYVDWENGDQFGENGTWTHPHVFKHSHGSHGTHQHKYAHGNGVPDDTEAAHKSLSHEN